MGVSLRVPDRAIARSLRIRGEPFDARLGLMAFLVAVAVSVSAVLAFGDASQRAAAVAVAAMSPAAIIDIRERRLPDQWVAFAAGVLAALNALSALIVVFDHTPPSALLGSDALPSDASALKPGALPYGNLVVAPGRGVLAVNDAHVAWWPARKKGAPSPGK